MIVSVVVFVVYRQNGVERMIVLALGAVGYSPAIPYLIKCLSDPNETLRGCVAWSLGALKALEAKERLKEALKKKTTYMR